MKTVNCENCKSFSGLDPWPFEPYCKLGKQIMYRKSKLPGIKDDPGYRRKCNDFEAKEEKE